MKKDKKDILEETSIDDTNVDEDLENLYRELEHEDFTSTNLKLDDVKEETVEEIEPELEKNVLDDEPEKEETVEEIEPEPEKEEPIEHINETKEETIKNEKEPKMKKKFNWQLLFNLISVIFIVGCIVFYGMRLIKYYKIFNPKGEDGTTLVSLGAKIKDDNAVVSEGDGVYSIDGEYVFKGVEVNNYVKYSNLLWRVVKVNQDNTVVLVTDNVVNNLVWDNEVVSYEKSNLHDWLNEEQDESTGVFERILNDKGKYLLEMTICADEVDDLKSITCKDRKDAGYLSLLSISDYANSVNEDSYLNNTENIWLYNVSKDKVWNVTDGNITSSEPTKGYGVKPTITVKNSVSARKGSGTLEDPYIIEEVETSLKTGKYFDFNGDKWIVYEDRGDILRLAYEGLYNNGDTTYKFSNNGSKFDPVAPYTLAYHLNNSIYNSFNYNDVMIDCDWYVGSYAKEGSYDFKNIYEETLQAKVGLYNVSDLKFNGDYTDYFYLTPDGNDKVYGYNKNTNLYSMRYTYMKPVRPSICINNDKVTGTGTLDDPFKLVTTEKVEVNDGKED